MGSCFSCPADTQAQFLRDGFKKTRFLESEERSSIPWRSRSVLRFVLRYRFLTNDIDRKFLGREFRFRLEKKTDGP